jgi:hypothetical protein
MSLLKGPLPTRQPCTYGVRINLQTFSRGFFWLDDGDGSYGGGVSSRCSSCNLFALVFAVERFSLGKISAKTVGEVNAGEY